jgi:hypothetical protein
MTKDAVKNSIIEMIEIVSRENEERTKTAEIGKPILNRAISHVDDYIENLSAFNLELISDEIAQHTSALKNKLTLEGELLIKRAAHSTGALEGLQLVYKKVIEIEEAAIQALQDAEEKEKMAAELERKIEEEGFDEDTPRAPGERPESIRKIRNTKKSIKEKKEKDNDSS